MIGWGAGSWGESAWGSATFKTLRAKPVRPKPGTDPTLILNPPDYNELTVTLEVELGRSTPAPETFRADVQVINAENIQREIFVFDTEHERYQYVAMIFDLENYPNTRALAQELGLPFYRQKTVSLDFDALRDGVDFVTVTRNRINLLVSAWEVNINQFRGYELIQRPTQP